MILLIDNYDSFVYNLVQYLNELGADTVVFRNDKVDIPAIEAMRPDGIIISPGPCTPKEAGISKEIVRRFKGEVPILGVCLGHQVIGEVFGAVVRRAVRPMHGKISLVRHLGIGTLATLPNPLRVCRYHSLVVDEQSLPDELIPTSYALDDGELMGLMHRTYPIEGIQFHPESIYTEAGHAILSNFLRWTSRPGTSTATDMAKEVSLDVGI